MILQLNLCTVHVYCLPGLQMTICYDPHPDVNFTTGWIMSTTQNTKKIECMGSPAINGTDGNKRCSDGTQILTLDMASGQCGTQNTTSVRTIMVSSSIRIQTLLSYIATFTYVARKATVFQTVSRPSPTNLFDKFLLTSLRVMSQVGYKPEEIPLAPLAVLFCFVRHSQNSATVRDCDS